MKEQTNSSDVIESPTHNIESQGGEVSFDFSPLSNQLEEILNIIKNELELKKKKEEEEKKKLEEEKETFTSELETKEEKEELFFSSYNTLVTDSEVQTVTLQDIKKQNDELIFLHKMSFVFEGVFLALVCVLIFQLSFKR